MNKGKDKLIIGTFVSFTINSIRKKKLEPKTRRQLFIHDIDESTQPSNYLTAN